MSLPLEATGLFSRWSFDLTGFVEIRDLMFAIGEPSCHQDLAVLGCLAFDQAPPSPARSSAVPA